MPDFSDRWPENVPGKFYVDSQCTDCDLCRETAPTVFKRSDEGGYSYVYRQPETEDEIGAALEAAEGCCVNCIGIDGDRGDWTKPPEPPAAPAPHKPGCGCRSGKRKDAKPWWRFW